MGGTEPRLMSWTIERYVEHDGFRCCAGVSPHANFDGVLAAVANLGV